MARRDKLLERVRNNPRAVAPHDLWALLEAFGFTRDRVTGSHYIFVRQVEGRGVTLVIPLRKPHIKPGYVKEALAVIERIREAEKGNE